MWNSENATGKHTQFHHECFAPLSPHIHSLKISPKHCQYIGKTTLAVWGGKFQLGSDATRFVSFLFPSSCVGEKHIIVFAKSSICFGENYYMFLWKQVYIICVYGGLPFLRYLDAGKLIVHHCKHIVTSFFACCVGFCNHLELTFSPFVFKR